MGLQPTRIDARYARSTALDEEIIYGRDAEGLRFFVSSRMNATLNEARKRAAATIDRMPTHRSWWWERDAGMGVLHSVQECVKYAGASDGIVLLVAGELSPIVYAEYEAAKAASAQRYIFIYERPGEQLPDDVRDFIDRERETVVTRNFQNEAELETHLFQALIRSGVRAAREGQIERRQRARVNE